MSFIAINKKTGDYDFYYNHPVTGKRTKKRIVKADGSQPSSMKEAEKLIAAFRREVEDLDGIRTRERAVIEIAQSRQLIASRTHQVKDLILAYRESPKYPASAKRIRYVESVFSRFIKWCDGQGISSVTDFTGDQASKYVEADGKGKASKTQNDHRVIMAAIFRANVKKLGLASNPFDEVEKPRITHVSRESFSIEQVEKICSAFETWFDDGRFTPPENDQVYVGFLLGLYAGCRLKDACLMRWDSIDLDKMTLTFTPAKTKHSSGKAVTLPIIPGREKDWIEKAKAWDDGSGYVAPALAAMYNASNVKLCRLYIKCFTLATGVKNRREVEGEKSRSLYGFHSLRHTCASILANAGVDLNVIASLVGHSSTAITQVYTHISAQRQADEMRRAFGAGAGIKADIIKIIDAIDDERKLKNILAWLKSI